MEAQDVEQSLPGAMDAGYRLIDTATSYRNECHVGRVLKENMRRLGIGREDVFVTSKLQTADQGYEAASKAIDVSLGRLDLEYIDLYLVHWPGAAGHDPNDPENLAKRTGSWKALEEALQQGKVRAIGVSNYTVRHLQEMEQYAQTMPMVNQIELHPLYYPSDVISYCQDKGILVQAYSSLGRGQLLEAAFLDRHEPIKVMAATHKVTTGQIFLKWALQHGFGILPKSSSPGRVHENAQVFHFTLTDAEMDYLDAIHVKETRKICWDPQIVA